EESPVFFRRPLQVEHKLLELLGHDVKRLSQFADLGPALEVNALTEIAPRNSPAGFGERLERIGNLPSHVNAQTDTGQNRQQRQQARSMLHFENTAIGFPLRLLHYDRPVESRYRAVGPQHLDRVPALDDRELFGSG